jgi:hypothetical protein
MLMVTKRKPTAKSRLLLLPLLPVAETFPTACVKKTEKFWPHFLEI